MTFSFLIVHLDELLGFFSWISNLKLGKNLTQPRIGENQIADLT